MFAIMNLVGRRDKMELKELSGVGPKTEVLLNKLGIYTILDLIEFYPFRYEVITLSDLNQVQQGDKVTITGIIDSNPQFFRFKGKMDRMTFRVNTGTRLLRVTIFNRGFMRRYLTVGKEVTLSGKIDLLHNGITASNLWLSKLEQDKTMGIYHTTYGLSMKQLKKFIDEALKQSIVIPEYIPSYLKEKYHFMDKEKSILELHHPTQGKLLKQAILRTKYEELFIYMLKMNMLKREKHHTEGLLRTISFEPIETFIQQLPFSLTEDQRKAVKLIYEDLTNAYAMNRLLQGDVGSGKTIVAVIAMYMNALSGYQSALMAPTEILATQHYHNIKSLLKQTPFEVALLTGSMTKKEKKVIYQKLEDGTIDILIGTHALISEEVTYKSLGLVITDEQHRFGVKQRSRLKEKGITPDILYMSATPIPRTYALTIYGDMDVSSIHTMPSGRRPVATILKKNRDMKEILTMMYQELKAGHQAYVVAPLIEDQEESDLENVEVLEKKFKRAFGSVFNVAALHGKMTEEEKTRVMNEFKENKIQVLISTTVIEVGVDVKNATMMVIFDAYRFGLSQIHQLRGRVGRNALPSTCILISDLEKERLEILTKTTDGFKISEEDFRLRGSGDLFGSRQSGDLYFKLANIKQDFNILLRAKEDSEEYLHTDEFKKIERNNKFSFLEKVHSLD